VNLLLKSVVLLILDDYFIVFLFLLIDKKVNVEIFISDVFGIDLHLRMTLSSFLKVLCDLPRNLLLKGGDDIRILQKFGFSLTELRVGVFVLPQQHLHLFFQLRVLLLVLFTGNPRPLPVLVVSDVLNGE
jgi:hypothetical protein